MLKVLIADDHEIVRRGIKQILLDEFSFAHIEEAVDTDSLIAKAINGKWDIVISDLAMPGGGGLEALKIIKEKIPELPILFFSSYPEDQYAMRIIKAGGDGYINKDTGIEELCKALRQVLSGKKYVSDSVKETVGMSLSDLADMAPHELLSEGEFNIFTMLASGQSVTEIANTLSLASATISTCRSRILTKMDMKNNAELTLYAIEHKFI